MAKTYMKLDSNLVPISLDASGTISKEEQTKTIADPNFSSGNIVVTPDAGKVLTQVTVVKDNDLVPENIVKDVNIFGVEGTAESGGGTSVDRIGIICFSLYLSKGSSTTQTLKYNISSEMLSKTFFTDGKGNWYLPEDVSVYCKGTYKGKANTTLTLFSGTGTFSGYGVDFKVGTTPVALLLYFYWGDDDVMFTGYNSRGDIRISWDTGTGDIIPDSKDTEFIELPGNFFDDFPHSSSSKVDYWKKENFFESLGGGTYLESGWTLEDPD